VKPACDAVRISTATFYRSRKPQVFRERACRPSPATALTENEKDEVLAELQSKRFMDKSVRQVYAKLLDEGRYLCSISTMYRILRANSQVRERRNQARRGKHEKPVLTATRPNEVWSWDITKLRSEGKGPGYCLYVILDIFSRYIVGWMVAERESSQLAAQLIQETCRKQGVDRDTLTIHADRGGPMTSKTVAELMVELGVARSHSRPRVSNDNPFSEANFKTVKHAPEFPGRFGCIQDARAFCAEFFRYYNTEHYHTGIALLTPEMVHTGRAAAVLQARQQTLNRAYTDKRRRFSKGSPKVEPLPVKVCINRVEPAVSTC
jgi:putative transposase